MDTYIKQAYKILAALAALSLAYFFADALFNHSWRLWFLPYNLLLAWIPLLFATTAWRTRRCLPIEIGALLLWILFLPNSFYMVSDLIHMSHHYVTDLTGEPAMFFCFALTGFMLGIASLLLIHRAYLATWRPLHQWLTVSGVCFISALAIYLGRGPRWNSWDIATNPFGIVLDLFSLLIHPYASRSVYAMALSYYALIIVIYWCCHILTNPKHHVAAE